MKISILLSVVLAYNSQGSVIVDTRIPFVSSDLAPLFDNETGVGTFTTASAVTFVGYFDTLSNSQIQTETNLMNLLNDFVQFGEVNPFGQTLASPGFTTDFFIEPIPVGGNNFTGRNIFYLVGDIDEGSDLFFDDSGRDLFSIHSEIAIYDTGLLFGEDTSVSIDHPLDGSLLRGELIEEVDVGGQIFDHGIALERIVVPEPSVSLMLTLSLAGLGLRRSRRVGFRS